MVSKINFSRFCKKSTRKTHTHLLTSKSTCFIDCAEVKWEMFTFVKSKAEHNERRQIIRETWASVFYMKGTKITTIFVIGRANKMTQKKVDKEHKRFGDILQIDEDDGYQ